MKGTYCIIVNVKIDSQIKVGSLGKLKFAKGHYVYVGSALNNLEKRRALPKVWFFVIIKRQRSSTIELWFCNPV